MLLKWVSRWTNGPDWKAVITWDCRGHLSPERHSTRHEKLRTRRAASGKLRTASPNGNFRRRSSNLCSWSSRETASWTASSALLSFAPIPLGKSHGSPPGRNPILRKPELSASCMPSSPNRPALNGWDRSTEARIPPLTKAPANSSAACPLSWWRDSCMWSRMADQVILPFLQDAETEN